MAGQPLPHSPACAPAPRRRPDPGQRLPAAGADRPQPSNTGLSRDLLYDEMRRGNLAYVKVGRRRLITLHHLQQFLGIAPS